MIHNIMTFIGYIVVVGCFLGITFGLLVCGLAWLSNKQANKRKHHG
jgi:hypothetical protein